MDRKILLVGLNAFLVIGAVALGLFLFSKPETFRGTTYAEPYPVAPDIQLTRAGNDTFQLSETRGKVVALFFGYTSCPDVCPITLGELNRALEELGDQADQVQVLFVTVDPKRDSPEGVQEYVDHFNPGFIGLSGSEAELAKVWHSYGVMREVAESTSAVGYLVSHSARVTLIDPQGNLRVSLPFETPVEDIVHDLKLLLKESDG
jgi:protein SCO1/2